MNRKFKQVAPKMAWVSDITYYKLNGRNCYICVIIDLFSRKVLSYEVCNNMTSPIVSTPFYEAFINRGQPDGLIFHSDQGSQYQCITFRKRLKELGVTQSFSKPGCPYDNAVMESFFASLKKEEIHRSTYESIIELREAIEDYIDLFNCIRPHQSLGYLTPEQVEHNYYQT